MPANTVHHTQEYIIEGYADTQPVNVLVMIALHGNMSTTSAPAEDIVTVVHSAVSLHTSTAPPHDWNNALASSLALRAGFRKFCPVGWSVKSPLSGHYQTSIAVSFDPSWREGRTIAPGEQYPTGSMGCVAIFGR